MLSNIEFSVNVNNETAKKQKSVFYRYQTKQSFEQPLIISLEENVQSVEGWEYTPNIQEVNLEITFNKDLDVSLFHVYHLITATTLNFIKQQNNIYLVQRFANVQWIKNNEKTTLIFYEQTYGQHYCHLYLKYQPEVIPLIYNHE